MLSALRIITKVRQLCVYYVIQEWPSDWKIKSSKKVYDNQDLSVYEDSIDLGGKDKIYIRGIRPNYATVMPFVSDNEILMTKRYRHLTDSMQLEVPLGYIEEGETPEQAAVKTLQEKAGYAGQEIVLAGTYTLDYTMLEQKGHIFVTHGLRKTGRPESAYIERIDLVPMSIKYVRQYLFVGMISDTSSAVALYRALDYHNRRRS